jgi:hypothetical protein
MAADEKLDPPPKILEERGRGTKIKNQTSQGKLLRYWAWAQTPIEVGVYFPEANWKIEYWMSIVLPKVENEADPTVYLLALKEMWMIKLRGISNGVAQTLETFGNDFGVEVRYLFNSLRVWFVPIPSFNAGIKRPLAEEPTPKDKWYSPSDLMVFSAPPIDQVREEPTILFGPGCTLQERYPYPEVQGGKIALIAFKQMRAQKPPNCLDRMQSTYLKQVAYNQRVMEAEDGIAGINCDASHFLGDMAFDSEEQVIICVNSSETMKRNEEVIAGQLWMQGGRQMTASNKPFDGMANTRDSAVLAAAAEAVTWRHAGEPVGPTRKGQRVVVYPKDLPQLEAVLALKDPSIDPIDGHSIAYEAILQECPKFENPPVLLKEDSDVILSDPIMAEKVPEWMAIAKQVATGNRRRVLEDGDDKMNSSDEDDPDMKPDELTGMYTKGMDPEKGPIHLTQAQVAAQKAAAKAMKASKVPSSPSIPDHNSSDDDDLLRPEWIWSQTLGHVRRNKAWVSKLAESALALPAPEPERQPTPMSSDTEDQDFITEDQKRYARVGKKKSVAASQRAPEPKPVPAAKASKPTKGQESPETKVSHPMATRRQEASRAGSLRPGSGSGQTGTCVASRNPPKT